MSSGELVGKVAFVTGAAGDFGRAIAEVFVEQGAAVTLADLSARADELSSLSKSLANALPVHVDVRTPRTLREAVEQTVARFGSLDIAVCNAGVNVRKPALEVTEEDWDTVVDVNLRGVFFTAQACATQMLRQGRGGKVVCIASIMGLVASGGSGVAYCASKAGVVNLTRALAIEWAAHNIQVNSVAPTFARTALTERVFQDEAFLQSILSRTPNGKLATPRSIAEAVAFLASPRADLITGTTLPVDGGWTAW
jgi:NAD(P)-dependent dehydrogenase (short-subunit alcohol dehydrogenase family)